MLVLKRKVKESLVFRIGSLTFSVKVLDILREGALLGIEAPKVVEVWRSELVEQARKTNNHSPLKED